MRAQADAGRIRFDIRLLASGGGRSSSGPISAGKKTSASTRQEVPGKFLFGLGFFKKF